MEIGSGGGLITCVWKFGFVAGTENARLSYKGDVERRETRSDAQRI